MVVLVKQPSSSNAETLQSLLFRISDYDFPERPSLLVVHLNLGHPVAVVAIVVVAAVAAGSPQSLFLRVSLWTYIHD